MVSQEDSQDKAIAITKNENFITNEGREAGLMFRFRCSETYEILDGTTAQIQIFNESGEDISDAYDSEYNYFRSTWFDKDADGTNCYIHTTDYGVYFVKVIEAPRLCDSIEPTHSVPSEPISFNFNDRSFGYIDIYCPPLPKKQQKEATSSNPQRKAKTKAEKKNDRDKNFLYISYLAATLLVATLVFLVIFPLIYMTLYGSCCALAATGNGFSRGFKILEWYLSNGLLFNGLTAVSIIQEVNKPSVIFEILAFASSAALIVLFYFKFGAKIEDKVLIKNEMLDKLPPAEDSTIHGSGHLVRSLAQIRKDLPTYDPTSSDPNKTDPNATSGIFIGFIDGPIQAIAPQRVKLIFEHLVWHIQKRHIEQTNNRLGAKHAALPPEPAAPSTMRYVYLPNNDMAFYNTILLGDTRAGKSRRILLATIDLITRAGGSLLIIDPKGELCALTQRFVKARYGDKAVNIINFRNPTAKNTDCWNPMQPVIDAANWMPEHRDNMGRVLGDYTKMAEKASDLVSAILPASNDVGNSTYFNNGARSIIKSAILWVACNQSGCPDGQQSLSTVAKIIDGYVRPRKAPGAKSGGFQALWCPYKEILNRLPHDHPAVEAFATAAAAQDKELQCFCTTALTVLQDFRDRAIANLTSKTTVPLARLGQERSVTYLIIPFEKATYRAISNLYIQQSYAALIDEATNSTNGNKLANTVTYLCEELGQCPPIPDLDSKLTVSLGYGLQFFLIFQTLGQLVEKYEKDPASTIWSSCTNKILLQTSDTLITGDWICKQLGKYTVKTSSQSSNKGPMSFLPNNVGTSESLGQREVLMPSEVAQWSADIGSLVMTNKTRGPWVVNLPDVSETPTGELIGINDPELVSELYQDVYGDSKRTYEEYMGWDPCFQSMDPRKAQEGRYTEAEFKTAQQAFLRELSGKTTPKQDGQVSLDAQGPGVDSDGRIIIDTEERNPSMESTSPVMMLKQYLSHSKASIDIVDDEQDNEGNWVVTLVVNGINYVSFTDKNKKQATSALAKMVLDNFAKFFVLAKDTESSLNAEPVNETFQDYEAALFDC